LGEILSIFYHDIFDYPLTQKELSRWSLNPRSIIKGKVNANRVSRVKLNVKGKYIYISDREETVVKRLMRSESSKAKMVIANNASAVLSKIPTIKFVGVTGALAMENASDESDIDLMVISSKGTLWMTRLLSFVLLKVKGFDLRRSAVTDEKDKLCLNIWLDESDLRWRVGKRNIFTAHEIAQVVPLVDRDATHRKFISKNAWVKNFWPNAMSNAAIKQQSNQEYAFVRKIARLLEPLARTIQKLYMRGKVTREVVMPTRALFHPIDWSSTIEARMESIVNNLSAAD